MKTINLADKISALLPATTLEIIGRISRYAAGDNLRLYLTGGLPRDLLLGSSGIDVDLAVEGDAVDLGEKIAAAEKTVSLTVHRQFGTARIKWKALDVDLTSTRRESYAYPGALPAVAPGNIEDDLYRRDFSINAMAVSLNAPDYGNLIDPCGGRQDLEKRLIRVLHQKSFQDDATRIWRAVRYEQRLDFDIEYGTLELLRRDIPMLGTISSDRIYYELQCIFREQLPEKVLERAGELGLLATLNSQLKADIWLAHKYARTRDTVHNLRDREMVYLALLAYRLDAKNAASLATSLNLPGTAVKVLNDSQAIKLQLDRLAQPGLKASSIYHSLHGYTPAALVASSIACAESPAGRNIRFYLDQLRQVKAPGSGDDLIKQGIPRGPRIKEVLQQMLDAYIDEHFTSPV